MATTITDSIIPGQSGDWRFGGFLGERIDAFTDARIRSDFAREVIHRETIDAFRTRIDDRIKRKAGFWQGEFRGKWILSAIATCRYYGDDQLREFIAESARSIIETQDPDGYIGTSSDPGFLQPIDGNMNWNVWCRKYTLWGLLECGLLQASRVAIDVSLEEPEEFIFNLRIPSWSDETAVTVNGEDVGEPLPGQWFSLQRDWQSGDRVELALNMSLRAERFDPSHLAPDDDLVTWSEQLWARIHDHNPDAAPHTLRSRDALPHREAIALLRGPVVLSRDTRMNRGDIFGGLPAEFDLDRADAPMRLDPPKNTWQVRSDGSA